MKKTLFCVVALLAVATFGMALIHCGGGGDDKECTSNADCVELHGATWYCDHTVGKCKDGGSCEPQCTGKVCGPDGCDGTCGTCDAGETCNASGTCETCTPDCAGKECGDDGCGGSCGTCTAPETCTVATGQCEGGCTPECTGKDCGPDGCGDVCGTCDAGDVCTVDGACVTCTPDCTGLECGPDPTCDSSCGECVAPETCTVATGQCEGGCTPECTGKECGPDGCGDVCGTCAAGEDCDADGQCQPCTPDCTDLECGPDPICGDSCGTCPAGEACDADGQCFACTPDCTGRECGPDPTCQESCGDCDAGEFCDADGQCQTSTTHDGAGDYCNDVDTPCSEEPGAAITCLITDDPADGDGFCSFACTDADATAECTLDFTDGCCLDISGEGDFFCVSEEFCGGPGDREYLETCGTADTGGCIEELVCVGFGDEWGYCLYTCDYPDGACTDGGTCIELTSGEGACEPPGTAQHGELCNIVPTGCVPGLDCVRFEGTTMGYCAAQCNCSTGTGCPAGNPAPQCAWTNSDQTICWCGYVCPNQVTTDCPGGGTGWTCVNVGSTQPFWACIPE